MSNNLALSDIVRICCEAWKNCPRNHLQTRQMALIPAKGTRDNSAITLPTQFAGSGTLDRLVETARDYARQAASENTMKVYPVDFKL